MLKRWPGGLVEYFGMTEGGSTLVLIAHVYPDKLHTVGQPAPGHDIRVIDEDGHELPRGEIDMVGRSELVMSGYHNRKIRPTRRPGCRPMAAFIRTRRCWAL